MKALTTRTLKFDVRRNMTEWTRTVAFIYVSFMMVGGLGVDQYNKCIHYINDSDDIAQYRPSKTLQATIFALFCYIGLPIQTKSKHRVLASCLFFQAVITQMNKRNLKIKDF